MKEQVMCDERCPLIGFHPELQDRFVARRQLLAAAVSAPLKTVYDKVIIPLREQDKITAIFFNLVVPSAP